MSRSHGLTGADVARSRVARTRSTPPVEPRIADQVIEILNDHGFGIVSKADLDVLVERNHQLETALRRVMDVGDRAAVVVAAAALNVRREDKR